MRLRYKHKWCVAVSNGIVQLVLRINGKATDATNIGLWSLRWLSSGWDIRKSSLIFVQMWSIVDPLSCVGDIIICLNLCKTCWSCRTKWLLTFEISILKSPRMITGSSGLISDNIKANCLKSHIFSFALLCGARYIPMMCIWTCGVAGTWNDTSWWPLLWLLWLKSFTWYLEYTAKPYGDLLWADLFGKSKRYKNFPGKW